jgi:hypothetical protein
MKSILGSFLIIAGIIAMAGSANDCDGACMDTANTLGEMLMVVFIGLCLFATGAGILIKENVN